MARINPITVKVTVKKSIWFYLAMSLLKQFSKRAWI